MRSLSAGVLLAVLSSLTLQAQDFPGFAGGNYSGVYGTFLQPASIADSRFRVDIGLFGTHFMANNNYLGLSRREIENVLEGISEELNLSDLTLIENNNNQDKSLHLDLAFYMPSMMYTLSEKHAVAVSARSRTRFHLENVDPSMAKLIREQLEYPSLWVTPLENSRFSIQNLTWSEINVTYARVLVDRKQHFIKAGVTPKFVQGALAFYLFAENIKVMFQNADTLTIFDSYVNYGHNDDFEFTDNRLTFRSTTKPTMALDAGIVYEWRPRYKDYKYDMDGESDMWRRDRNKYKLRIGASITDLGRIRFTKGQFSHDFRAAVTNWDIQNVDFLDVEDMDDTIRTRFEQNRSHGTFDMRLPTALSAQIDYNIWKGFYVNVIPYYAFKFEDVPHKVHGFTNVSVTPRWENKWFGVYVPATYNEFQQYSVGLDLMLGPVIIGTNDILNAFARKHIYGLDFHFFTRIPLYYTTKRDRDNDKVSDQLDKCINVPGVWEFYGCPDRDGDHVEDALDNCPDHHGPAYTNGCPDTDGDRIADAQDECPEQAGLPAFNGCPDSDNDGIVDRDDRCPDQAGKAEMHGCPDTDNDNIADYEDLCPDKPGPYHNLGCPETRLIAYNKAGEVVAIAIRDNKGEFVFENLPADENLLFRIEGEDTDFVFKVNVKEKSLTKRKDGFFTYEKLKPEEVAINPMEIEDVPIKLRKEEEEVLARAFQNLEFDTGRDKIKPASLPALDQLAELLNDKPGYRLKLSGHSDNTGTYTLNMILSKKRAEAVSKYLQSKGVIADRIDVFYYGANEPVASNETEEGKQKNRRVEMKIIQ